MEIFNQGVSVCRQVWPPAELTAAFVADRYRDGPNI
jgi:hypothetical protein